ncbi:MAG: hypothetical protein KGH50_04505, partial [Candidatus Micrarchaeota archaeon]|nr:hypothetical protein [Candidatus Micrarchaeota archaeon]
FDVHDARDRELLLVAIVVAASFLSIVFFLLRLPAVAVIVTAVIAIAAGFYLTRWLSNPQQEPEARVRTRKHGRN